MDHAPAELTHLIHSIYAAFNRRDIDGALAGMSDLIDWPTASEGGRVIGKAAIRAYWTRQWAEYNPTVEPLEITPAADGSTHVRVHQLVKDLAGNILSDQEVQHIYLFENGLAARMDVIAAAPAFR